MVIGIGVYVPLFILSSNETTPPASNGDYADEDNDGLSLQEEKDIGTNPFNTDGDGLNDGDEVGQGTDPLNSDTDSDGVIDSEDLFPLHDAQVNVAIKYFKVKVSAEDPLRGIDDPYFIITVNGVKRESQHFDERSYIYNPYSTTVNIPDDQRYVDISIEVWEDDMWDDNDQYDASSKVGSDPYSGTYTTTYDILGGAFTETDDGTWDGSSKGPQCQIKVEINTI